MIEIIDASRDWALLFGWICFVILWAWTIDWLRKQNYWMPTLYITGAIIFSLVTGWFCLM